jgi:hypothetical protein
MSVWRDKRTELLLLVYLSLWATVLYVSYRLMT